MPYKYVAINADNILVRGTVKAAAQSMAEEALRQAGHRVVSLKHVSSVSKWEQLFPSLFSIKGQDITTFASNLATMLEAGVRILPALQLLEKQIRSRAFKRVLSEVLDDVGVGSSFADALDKHPQAFPDVFRRMVRVGERLGEMDVVLKQGAIYLQRQAETGKKIKRALMYPAILISISLLVITLLVTVAMPPMIDMLNNLNVELPLPTRILTFIIGFTGAYPMHLLVGIGAVVGGASFYFKKPHGKRVLQRFLVRVPGIGKAILAGEMARFSRTVAMLSHAGLSLPETIAIAKESASNLELQDALVEVEEGLLAGEGLSAPLARQPIFPPMLVQMTKVAEETGSVGTSLASIADFYDKEADETSSAIISILEPAVTVGMAMMVAFIALSVIMPMYNMIGSME